MADDEGALLIASSHLGCVDPGDALLVQHMGLGAPVDALEPGDAGRRSQLVDIRRVHRVHRLPIPLAEVVGHHDAELGRMVAAANVVHGVLDEPLVDDHDTFALAVCTSSASDEDID